MAAPKTYSGNIVDIKNRRIFPGTVSVVAGKIASVIPSENVPDVYILPGFIDAHIHIESSMVTPQAFAKIALTHGTVATVSDPHEIANVCGMEGVEFMIQDGNKSPLKFFFGAPSCVPATGFENAGATLGSAAVDRLLASDDIWYLSEMMNYPGVLADDPEILAKIRSAQKYGKPVDGHAPGLRGDQARKYIDAGISTDHECTTLDEATERIAFGMKIIIREGSAAKNFEALHPLIASHPEMVMFCSDDKHPDDLLKGHINLLVKRGLALGYDLFDLLQIACVNPVQHYHLPVGTLHPNDPADFIVVDNLKDFNVRKTIIDGIDTAELPGNNGADKTDAVNQFNIGPMQISALEKSGMAQESTPVIEAIDGSLVTEKTSAVLHVKNGFLQPDPTNDILKIVVVNRYKTGPPAIGFIKNFHLKECAIASTVAHDSHNIIAVGSSDELLLHAINKLIDSRGGLSAVSPDRSIHLPLPIAGLMSDQSCQETGRFYEEISAFAKARGCNLNAPFMTLSFMALLVIPKIKISDMGMFDAENFGFY